MEEDRQEWPRNYPVSSKSILEISIEFLTEIEKRQAENFKKAGEIMGDKIIRGGLIKLVGTGGHSYIPPMDMSHRSGALVAVNPTFDVSSSPINGGMRSSRLEKVVGYFRALMDYFQVERDDVVIIFNNVAIGSGVIDAALECKERGAITIGVGSSIWQEDIPIDFPLRHPSKKNLRDIVDLFIDDYNPVGDTTLEIEGLEASICPISTITDAYIVRRIEEESIKYMLSKGFKTEVWISGNKIGGHEANVKNEAEYWHKIKML